MEFSELQLHPHIMSGVQKSGYVTPTPIQAQSIPLILSGGDLLGIAQTGTGKTAAFVIPALQGMLVRPKPGLRTLVLAPTRELADQIHETFVTFCRRTAIKCMTIYGGVSMQPQLAKLRGGAQVVVACPGRLLDHVKRGTIDLSKIDTLVLDEADRMFDMGFMPEIRKIVSHLPVKRQTLLFSATMPEEVRKLADEVLTNPETVSISDGAMADTVSHTLYPVGQDKKTSLLLSILRSTEADSVLIFTRTKHRASRIAEKLGKEGFKAASLQGNLSQNRRKAALAGFKCGDYRILVATDIAARGIDVASVSHVINFDMPNTVEDYTHRTGRTGRACRTGDAFSLVTPEDRSLVRAIEKSIPKGVAWRIPEGAQELESDPTDREPRFAAGRERKFAAGRESKFFNDRQKNKRFKQRGRGQSAQFAAQA